MSGTNDDSGTLPTNRVTMNGDRTVSVQFAAQACPVDPATGHAVARMISPANGATLPVGAVTFRWCNANADYFLTVESVAGAHDIFFAFAGGAGTGAGVNTLTLGPGCAAAPPTGCIPAKGESIFRYAVHSETGERARTLTPPVQLHCGEPLALKHAPRGAALKGQSLAIRSSTSRGSCWSSRVAAFENFYVQPALQRAYDEVKFLTQAPIAPVN